MRIILALFLIIGMTQVAGCAFGSRYVKLSYPPETQIEAAMREAQPVIPGPRSPVVVLTVNDAREDRDRIGNVRNSFGADTASILTEGNIAVWVHDAIALELDRSGYQVVGPNGASSEISADRLTANVMKVYCDVYMVYDGEVTLQITLKRADEAPSQTEYPVKVNSGLAWALSGSAAGESLAQALQTAIRDMLRDLGYTG